MLPNNRADQVGKILARFFLEKRQMCKAPLLVPPSPINSTMVASTGKRALTRDDLKR